MKELLSIQSALVAPKGQYNSFGKYKYRSCEDILSAIKPLLKESNCSLIISDDIVPVGARIYVRATATLTNAEGEQAASTAFAREEESKKGMDASQVTGAASSYARKYALCGLFAIDDGRDADALNTSPAYTQPAAPAAKSSSSDELSPDETLQAYALPAIEQATTREELVRIWNDFKALQGHAAFMQALSARRKALGITSKHSAK